MALIADRLLFSLCMSTVYVVLLEKQKKNQWKVLLVLVIFFLERKNGKLQGSYCGNWSVVEVFFSMCFFAPGTFPELPSMQ